MTWCDGDWDNGKVNKINFASIKSEHKKQVVILAFDISNNIAQFTKFSHLHFQNTNLKSGKLNENWNFNVGQIINKDH